MVEANGSEETLGWRRLPPRESRAMLRQSVTEMEGLVRSTLGPYGLDKLVVRPQESGEIRGFVSNDGVSIIEEFEGETDHPVATHFIQLVESQEADYGDGTTTATILTAELLKKGLDLIDEGVGADTVVEGFSMAAQRSLEAWNDLGVPLTSQNGTYDREQLTRVAITGLSNGDESLGLNGFDDDVVDAVLRVADTESGVVDLDYVWTETVPGASVADSELIPGGLIRKDQKRGYVHLPVLGSVLYVDGDVQPRELRRNDEVTVDGRAEVVNALRSSADVARSRLARAIRDAGIVGVVTTGDVDDEVARLLGADGIVTVQQVTESRVAFLARATGGTLTPSVTSPENLDFGTCGSARIARRQGYRDKRWLEIAGTGDEVPDAMTFVVRAGSESVAGEAERRVKDGLNAVRAAVLDPVGLPVGGASECEAARAVREFAPRFSGREQLAIEAFADVLESIPTTLARNAGLDPVDSLLDLRTRHAAGHRRAGISADRTVVDDTVALGAVEPRAVQTSALVRAVEFAVSYLRIDSILVSEMKPSPVEQPTN